MKNSSDRKPMSALKKTALIGGGVLAAGAGGAALALRKKPLRIGTPLSKSKVVNYTPIKTKQAKGRVVEMAARLDAVLHQFQAISTAEQPYDYSGDYPSSPAKPNFPCLYLSRSTDKGLMKMQGMGQALVNYKIKSRSIDEDAQDGVPLYGASIEIQSLEPVAGGEENELSETLFLREFAGGWKDENDYGVDPYGRGITAVPQKEKGVKAHFKRNAGKYVGVLAGGLGGGVLAHAGQNVGMLHAGLLGGGVAGKGVDAIRENRQVKRTMKKDFSEGLAVGNRRHEFAVARDRDGEGRYSAGNVPGADDYAIAGSVAPKKRSVIGAGLAGAAAGGAATYGALRTKTGQKLTTQAAKGVMALKGKFSK